MAKKTAKTVKKRAYKKREVKAELQGGTPGPASFPAVSPEEMKKLIRTETRIILNEVGSTGLSEFSGFISEAYNAQLQWPNVSPIYQRIRRSTPEITSIARAFTSWGRNVDIVVDLPDKPSDDDKRYQGFVEEVFDDMEGGKSKLIETMVSRVPFDGWYWWEAVPAKRDPDWKPPNAQDEWRSQYDDGLTGFRRLAPRDTSRFQQWVFNDNKRMVGMIQQDYPRESVTLPLKQSLHLTYGDTNNPEGLSPLEAVWRLERLRYGFEVIMGIGFEHSAGFLSVQKTESGSLSNEDKADVRAAAKAVMTAQEGNYALWPFGMEGAIQDIPFQSATSILETIKYYSIMMYSVYMMQFIALNTLTGTGALASATDSSDISVFTFNAMLDGFVSQIDDQIGRRLYDWNKDYFPGITKRPKFRITHIDKKIALNEMGSFLTSINGIIPLGDEDYKEIRDKSGFLPKNLPNKTPEQIQAEKEARIQAEYDSYGVSSEAALNRVRRELAANSRQRIGAFSRD